MKYGLMTSGALAVAAQFATAPVVYAQGMWWVEGDRYCSDFGNRSRNSAMCGNPRKGETEPKPSFRYDFNFPRVPLLDDQNTANVPVPADRPAAAPSRAQPRR